MAKVTRYHITSFNRDMQPKLEQYKAASNRKFTGKGEKNCAITRSELCKYKGSLRKVLKEQNEKIANRFVFKHTQNGGINKDSTGLVSSYESNNTMS